VALVGRLLGSNPYNGHRAQRPLPDHLPRVPPAPEANFTAGPVRALGHRVAMQREPVGFHVNVPRTVVRVPGVVEGAQFGLVGGHRGEQLGAERLLGELADAVHPPDVVVLVVEEAVPVLADEGAGAEVGQLEKGEDGLEDVVWQLGGLHHHGGGMWSPEAAMVTTSPSHKKRTSKKNVKKERQKRT
jgi:hypothetical protein